MVKQLAEITGSFVSPEERARLVGYCARMTGNRDSADDTYEVLRIGGKAR